MMIAPPDSTIDALLSKDAYQIVDTVVQRYLGTFGINLDKLKTMRPAALSTQLAQLMAVRRLPDFEMNNLLDHEVERRVKALGKPAHSLETVDFQLQLLLGDPLPKQAADLLEMCKNIGEVERNFDDMHNAYATQDFDKLMLAATDPSATTPEDMERICYDRNENGSPRLSRQPKRQHPRGSRCGPPRHGKRPNLPPPPPRLHRRASKITLPQQAKPTHHKETKHQFNPLNPIYTNLK